MINNKNGEMMPCSELGNLSSTVNQFINKIIIKLGNNESRIAVLQFTSFSGFTTNDHKHVERWNDRYLKFLIITNQLELFTDTGATVWTLTRPALLIFLSPLQALLCCLSRVVPQFGPR